MEAAPDSVRRARPLLGTFVEITASHVSLADASLPDASLAVGSLAELEAAVEEAFEAVARVHRVMSFHDPASDLSRLNREAGTNPVAVDAWTFEVLEIAVGLNRHSAGVFDINVAPALQALGLLPGVRQYQVQHQVQDSASRRIEDAIELLPGFQVRFRQPCVKIDLGGIGDRHHAGVRIDLEAAMGGIRGQRIGDRKADDARGLRGDVDRGVGGGTFDHGIAGCVGVGRVRQKAGDRRPERAGRATEVEILETIRIGERLCGELRSLRRVRPIVRRAKVGKTRSIKAAHRMSACRQKLHEFSHAV